MKTIYTVSVLLVLVIGAVCGAALLPKSDASAKSDVVSPKPVEVPVVEAESPQASPFPDIQIPGVPSTGNCCLFQLEKRAQGTRQATFGNPYACQNPTVRGDMRVDMQLVSAGPVCDQLAAVIPNNSRLRASGALIRRSDGFAHFIGSFEIVNPAGATIFKGAIETIDRIGTHHLFFNCEQCNSPSHFEGWIQGKGTAAPTSNFAIRAIIVSRGTVPSLQQPSTPMVGSLNGTLIRCP